MCLVVAHKNLTKTIYRSLELEHCIE